jgi:signal transduction histidine kinase
VAETLAVRAERTRIARELHDSVAHHLSVVAVQASAAAMQLDHNSDGARRALEAVREAARQCLGAMPSIVRALRADDTALADGTWTPAETLADLPEMVERLRRAGCTVDLRMDAMPPRLPPGVSESAYRVAQEALTNVVKHARDADAVVAVTGDPAGVTVEVTNDEPPEPVPAGSGGGHGLAGMRERVSLFGGTFSAGPRPGGGFAVRAHFPTVAARAAAPRPPWIVPVCAGRSQRPPSSPVRRRGRPRSPVPEPARGRVGVPCWRSSPAAAPSPRDP